MQHYIKIKKIWQDEIEDFFSIQMVARSKVIWAQAHVYATSETIDDLLNKLNGFISSNAGEALWENGVTVGETPVPLSLKFLRKDKLGHVLVEVYMELDDGRTLGGHNCCFYVETDLGLLEKFHKRLHLLKLPDLEIEITLNEL